MNDEIESEIMDLHAIIADAFKKGKVLAKRYKIRYTDWKERDIHGCVSFFLEDRYY